MGLLARQLHAALDAAGSTLAVAESLTGGRLAVTLAEAPGASSVFKGLVTAYATDVKAQVLHVPPDLLDRKGLSTARSRNRWPRRADPHVRHLRARHHRRRGPRPQDGHPPGTVHIAVAGPHGTASVELGVHGDREVVQHAAVIGAHQLLHGHLRPTDSPIGETR
ncbi:CinA family protein [Kitasatospora sp. NPDC057015]|uniref:CinA family protein n=1 Tax=Kitasatospora sp. NPDC057015 TaxID=3346001 RepID=UPI00362E31EF